MTTQAHTPTPWGHNKRLDGRCEITAHHYRNGKLVDDKMHILTLTGVNPDQVNVNAYFIVQAVNAYDANQALIAEQAAEIARLEQLVCDFQASGMICVNGQDDPSEVTPKHIETHIAHQRQTVDALTAALESLVDWADGYSSLPDNYIRRNARSVLDALEKARGDKNANET